MNDSKNKKIIGYIAYVLAFLLAFYVVKEIRNERNIQTMSANVESEMKDRIESAQQKTDGPVMEELMKNGVEEFNTQLDNVKNENKKLNIAANNFYGYYMLNVDGRQKYCEKFGVKMPKFINAFKNFNQQLFDKASKIQAEEQRRNGQMFSYDQLSAALVPTFSRILDQDFSDIKKIYNLNDAEACELLENNAAEVVKGMDYKQRNVQAAALLLSYN